ncbi:hypothetical protein [Actinomadura rubrisoli]|uniref:hypothetical protein n=1 Tax=Actinomadura rubrisoli TaxID=2530368 RepID=UPI001405021F|nr:hypothetical protein [Actinomadura rubrisoli]
MLRLHDHRTGRPEEPPGGRVLRVHLLDGAGHRALVVADLLRRAAERAGRHVRTSSSPRFAAQEQDWTEYGVQPFEVLGGDAPVPEADLYMASEDGAEVDAFLMTVPRETGDWHTVVAGGSLDPLHARLAILEAPYREPLHLSAERFRQAADRLDRWRAKVAEWATEPGRPMSREHAGRAETALASDLDSPSALAVLDELAADPDVPPGTKLETFIHLDLVLGLNLVSAIGRA